jgi:hypothetical protein
MSGFIVSTFNDSLYQEKTNYFKLYGFIIPLIGSQIFARMLGKFKGLIMIFPTIISILGTVNITERYCIQYPEAYRLPET